MEQKVKMKPNWKDPNTTAENEKVPRYLKWAWSSRAISLGINTLFIMQLTFYCTDVLEMSAGLVGALLLASKVFDGITDIIAGYVIDRTHTRWGKGRPYEIFIILAWVFTVLLYSVPDVGIVGKSIYIFILYALINSICATFLNGSEAIYLSRTVRSEANRVSIMSFNGGIVMVGYLIVSIMLPQILKGIGTSRTGWTLMALSFAIPMSIIGILRFLFVKEVAATEVSTDTAVNKKVPLKTAIQCVLKNKYIFILSGMGFVAQLVGISTGVVNYYCKYIIGDIGVGSLINICSLATPLCMLFFPMLTRKIGTTKVLRYAIIMGIGGLLIRIFGGTNMITLIFGTLLFVVAQLPISLMNVILLIDCMDYGEWKTGIRVEGMLSSIFCFVGKLGGGVTSGLIGIIMGMANYDGNLAVQSASANIAIIALFNYIPLAVMIIWLVLTIVYKLGEEIPMIREELAVRRSNQS